MTHELQKLVASGVAFLFAVGVTLAQAITENLDAESLIGYGVGAVSTGTVFWLVWTDRRGTTRADMTQESRISELKTALEEMTEDRDFWRARALGIDLPKPHIHTATAETVVIEEVSDGGE